jgi:hypothetical protein
VGWSVSNTMTAQWCVDTIGKDYIKILIIKHLINIITAKRLENENNFFLPLGVKKLFSVLKPTKKINTNS